jgi:hypothetical protein
MLRSESSIAENAESAAIAEVPCLTTPAEKVDDASPAIEDPAA